MAQPDGSLKLLDFGLTRPWTESKRVVRRPPRRITDRAHVSVRTVTWRRSKAAVSVPRRSMSSPSGGPDPPRSASFRSITAAPRRRSLDTAASSRRASSRRRARDSIRAAPAMPNRARAGGQSRRAAVRRDRAARRCACAMLCPSSVAPGHSTRRSSLQPRRRRRVCCRRGRWGT